jgi:hypothetical protein
MFVATTSGWAAIAVGVAALGGAVASVLLNALVAAELRGFIDLVARAQMYRAGRDLNLENPEEASRFIEEWQADLADLEDRPLTRLRYALALRRSSRELARELRRDRDEEARGKRA